jgi:uncharacterized protein
MAILLWIVRILAFLFLARFVLRILFGARPATRPRAGGPRAEAPERVGGTLVRDPHCGTYLPESRAIAVRSGDETRYFCSTACRDAYVEGRETASTVAH